MKDLDYGDESIIASCGAYQVRTAAFPTPCDYVRVVKLVDGAVLECVYWNADEWVGDGQDVMGAIMGAIKSVVDGTYREEA